MNNRRSFIKKSFFLGLLGAFWPNLINAEKSKPKFKPYGNYPLSRLPPIKRRFSSWYISILAHDPVKITHVLGDGEDSITFLIIENEGIYLINGLDNIKVKSLIISHKIDWKADQWYYYDVEYQIA